MTPGLNEALSEQERSVAGRRAEVEALERELEEQAARLSRFQGEVVAVEALVEVERQKSDELLRLLGRR